MISWVAADAMLGAEALSNDFRLQFVQHYALYHVWCNVATEEANNLDSLVNLQIKQINI